MMQVEQYSVNLRIGRKCCPTVLLTMCFLGSTLPGAHSQTPAEVQQAIKDISKGDADTAYRIKKRHGDKALGSFAAARFNKDVYARMAALEVVGTSLDSLLFLLPMIEDDSREIARAAITKLADAPFYSRNDFQKLQAEQVVPRIAVALKKHPEIAKFDSRKLLLLLCQYKKDPGARALLGRLLKVNGWDGFFVRDTPTKWDDKTIAALLAQCEMGRLNPAQVQAVFENNPETRLTLISDIYYVNNKSLLRYALSLLYDKTQIMSGMNDVESPIVYSEAWTAFQRAAKIEIECIKVDGIEQYKEGLPLYNKADITRLYAFYGLTEK